VVPDLDVFSSAAYGAPLGHRGLTHSLAFALLVSAIAATATFRHFRAKWWLLVGTFFAIIASHGLLDAMTRGGDDIPLFRPLDGHFGNWGPIPVADIAFELPDPRTSRAWRAELLWIWLPGAMLLGMVTAYRR
jgi:inner membrane protein